MGRILIFGNSGSGKSTLAKGLREAEGLAHLDLDTIAWKNGPTPERMALSDSRALLEDFIHSSPAWVIEGCYADLLDMVASHADEIIFLDLPVSECIGNARARPWEPHKYESRATQDANLEMLVDWIAEYDAREDTFSRRAHCALFERFPGKKTRYVSNDRVVIDTTDEPDRSNAKVP